MSLYKLSSVKENREQFANKVIEIAAYLGINPDWLMAVMYLESGINPAARNKITNATGLIQFMPDTAKSLGTTIADLSAMSNVRQLDYVKAYLSPYKGKMRSLADTYLTVFYPAAISKPSTWAFPAIVQNQNPTFKNFLIDGKLTKQSIVNYLSAKFSDIKTVVGLSAVSILVVFGFMYLFLNN